MCIEEGVVWKGDDGEEERGLFGVWGLRGSNSGEEGVRGEDWW